MAGECGLGAFDLETHGIAWRTTEPSLEYDEDVRPSGLEPTQALAAGGGIIVVPWERSLAAFRSAR